MLKLLSLQAFHSGSLVNVCFIFSGKFHFTNVSFDEKLDFAFDSCKDVGRNEMFFALLSYISREA